MYYRGLYSLDCVSVPKRYHCTWMLSKEGLLLSSFKESANSISYEYFIVARGILRYFDASGNYF